MPRGGLAVPRGDQAVPRGDQAVPRGDQVVPKGDQVVPKGDREGVYLRNAQRIERTMAVHPGIVCTDMDS